MLAQSHNNAIAVQAVNAGSAAGRAALYLALLAFGAGLIALAAKIQIPFWPVPMTLQTMAILGVAAAYGSRLGTASVLAYLAAGLAGLPVFAGPAAGPLYFAGPTAGFLAGFVIIALIVGAAADRGLAAKPLAMGGVMLAANAICFALGFAWLAFIFVSPVSGETLGATTAFAVGIQPYILSDLVKVALAAALVAAVSRSFAR